MNFEELTDSDIDTLIKTPKRVSNPKARWSSSRGSQQKNFIVDGGSLKFGLYLRQSMHDGEHFSCGLYLRKPTGEKLTLLRYNGASHIHDDIEHQCHIHKATEAAIAEGKKPERYATATKRYHSLDGALYCLCSDANIAGLSGLKPDSMDMFKNDS